MKKILFIFIICVLSVVSIHTLEKQSALNLLRDDSISEPEIRSIPLSEESLCKIKSSDSQGECLAKEILNSVYGKNQWNRAKYWNGFAKYFYKLFLDMKQFPLDKDHYEFSYENSWDSVRTYGGTRTHEGVDLMPPKQKRDYYKVYSVSDGVITNIGWLPQGGWRVGITADNGTYFYYAHLSSYAEIEKGDSVKAGEVIGYMGDTGYSEIEGTTGNFPVHLHFGIYFPVGEEEISVNPYWILRCFG